MKCNHLCFAILFSFIAFGQCTNTQAKERRIIESVRGVVGETLFVKLPGNPDAGYGWKFNKDLSSGPDLVEIDILGWLLVKKDRPIFFMAQSAMNVAIHPKAPGTAELAFDYSRELAGRTYSTTSVVRVTIKPKQIAP